MRTPVIAGNWKCNMRLESAYKLASGLRERVDEIEGIEKVVCPPFVYLATVEVALSMSTIKLGAQDVHWEDDVAATGEIGPQMLAGLGGDVIIGDPGRRPRCGGETAEERQANRTQDVLLRQPRAGLDGVDAPDGFVIAYEPVWAIGTGNAATTQDATDAIA